MNLSRALAVAMLGLQWFHGTSEAQTYSSTWGPAINLSGPMQGQPAVVSYAADVADVFIRGTDNMLYTKSWRSGAWSANWYGLGDDQMASDPFAFSTAYGVIHVLYRNVNNKIRHRWWDGSWKTELIDVSIAGMPAAIPLEDGAWDLIWRGGSDNKLYSWRNHYGWGVLAQQTATVLSSPIVIGTMRVIGQTGTREDVFYQESGGLVAHLYRLSSDATGWTYESLGGPSSGSPSVASTGRNALTIAIRGTDNQLYTRTSDDSGSFAGTSWTGRPFVGFLATPPSIAATGSNRVDIAYVTSTGGLGITSMQGTTWTTVANGTSGYASTQPTITGWAINRADIFARLATQYLEHKTSEVMCAVVYDSTADNATALRAFCGKGRLNQACTSNRASNGTRIYCDDASMDYVFHASPAAVAWYQGAINWARDNGHTPVRLDPGQLGLVGEGPRTGAWIGSSASAGTAAMVLESQSNLRGSKDVAWPTALRVFAPAAAPFGTMIHLVDRDASHNLEASLGVSQISVGYLALNGTSTLGAECPARARSIAQLGDIPTNLPEYETLVPESEQRAGTGITVVTTNPAAPAIHIEHVCAAHLHVGVTAGVPGGPKDDSCPELACLKLGVDQTLDACPAPIRASPVVCDPDNFGHAIPRDLAASCGCTPKYCEEKLFLAKGTAADPIVLANNSFCDVSVGFSVVGGNIEIARNIVLGGPTKLIGVAAHSPTPDAERITVHDNAFHQFDLGVQTDGSVYLSIGSAAFLAATGINPDLLPGDPGYVSCSTHQWLGIRQHFWDDGQRFFDGIPDNGISDPHGEFYGYGEGLSVHHNSFYKTATGVILYRQRGATIFSNLISWSRPASDPHFKQNGVGLADSAGCWIWDNTFFHIDGSDINVAATVTTPTNPGRSAYGAYDNLFNGFMPTQTTCYSMPNSFDNPANKTVPVTCPAINYTAGYISASKVNTGLCGVNQTPAAGGCSTH